MKKIRSNFCGVTLLELIVVMVIISVVFFMGSRLMTDDVDRTRAKQTLEEMKAIQTALIGDPTSVSEGTRLDWGYFGANADWPPNPDDGAGGSINSFVTAITPFLSVGTAADIGRDAWGNNYVFDDAGNANFTIISYGANNAAGGTDVNSDITLNIRKDDYEENFVVIYVYDAKGTLLVPAINGGDLAKGHISQVVFNENGGASYTWNSATAGLTRVNNGYQLNNTVIAGACSVVVTIANGTGGAPYNGTYDWRAELNGGASTITQSFYIYPKGASGNYNVLFIKTPGAATAGFNEV